MKRKVLLALAALVLVLGLLTAVVAVPVQSDLGRVRARLESGSVADLDDRDVAVVRADVQDALERIRSVPGKILGVVPVLSSNLQAVEAVAERLLPAIDAGLDLRRAAESLEEGGVLEEGKVDIRAVRSLRGPLEREVEALAELEDAARAGLSGWNVPAVWDALTTLSLRVAELRRDAEGLAALLDELDGLLGTKGKRTYLVMLLNNSELRGAGGVMTGVGTISVDNGDLNLGDFSSVHDLRPERLIEVPAPPTYERRYGPFLANTTIWLNTPYSPDIPDDALVAARLYEEVTGIATDGAIVADPRGVAALLPDDAEIPVRGSERILSPAEMPGFIYSGAYESFTDQIARREALIGVGEAAFEVALDQGLRGEDVLKQAGRAVAGGHLRVVSFERSERAALESLDVAGDLPDPAVDGFLVVAQNRGDKAGRGSKLDYWIDRKVGHECEVTKDSASCVTSTTLSNEAPRGLVDYVAGKPYGVLLTFLETYVPVEARVTGFEINDEAAPYLEERHAGWTSVGTDVEIAPHESATVEVAYELSLEDSYALTATPQPLAKDAAVEIALRLPQDWVTRGPGRREDEIFRYRGPMDEPLSITAEPDVRPGLPGLWQALVGFWREPLF